ncbi:MAG TPA: hypothetical protein DEH11_05005 [Actinobacteria bacterium]|nr:hypothetical protein [Actinomycetota bacterium]
MIIAGICYMPAGTVAVRGDLTVAPGALLDATTPGDPAANPLLPATVLVGGNVRVGRGAVLVLGCSPNNGCLSVTHDRIRGNLTGAGALAVVVHSTSIGGSASVLGGGGGAAGGAASGGCFTSPIPAPWSEDPALSNPATGSPQYTDFEDNSIGGSLSVIGVQTCWLGSFRNQVGGSVSFIGDASSDPDGMELGGNLAGGSLTCLANLPAVQFGDSGAAPNIAGGFAIGQCGFRVVLPNPAPEAGQGAGIPEHISVSARRLRTYSGTHTQVGASVPVPLGTPNVTQSGDTLVAELNNVVLAGTGLTGSVTVVPGSQLGSSGEAVLITVRPDGRESFLAVDNCECSFGGQTGTVTIRAYGTVTSNGLTRGTFLVTSGGAGNGGLSTLAGYGTFSSFGQPAGTLRLVEHLGITGSGDSAAATPKDRLGRLAWGAAAPGARISR